MKAYDLKNLPGLKSIYDPVSVHLSLHDVLKVLRSTDDQAKTERVRELKKQVLYLESLDQDANTEAAIKRLKEERRKLKEALPSVIFSGHIPIDGRKTAAAVEYHTGFFVLDFDHVSEFDKAFDIIRESPFSCLTFRSPSGDGIKTVVYAPGATPETHKGYIEQIICHYSEILSKVGIEPDLTGVNVNRHCFLPYEPAAILNEKAEPFEIDAEALAAWQEAQKARRQSHATGTPYEAAEALEKAHRKADRTYKEKGIRFEDAKHVWLANFSIYAKRFGASEDQARQYVYENILPESEITTDPFSPFRDDSYTAGDWRRPDPEREPVTGPRYLSEEADRLEAFIDANPRTLITTPTNCGKSRAALALSDDFAGIAHRLFEKHGKVTFAVPTVALAENLAAKYDIPLLTGRRPKESREAHSARTIAAVSAPIAIVIFDKVHEREAAVVFVDEAHELVKANYRAKKIAPVYEIAKKAERAIFMTATPPDGLEKFGFKRYESEARPDYQIRVHPQILKNKVRADEAVLSDIINRVDFAEGPIIVYYNHKENGKTFAKAIQPHLPKGKRATIINTATRGDDYEYLVKHSRLPDDVAVAVVTKFIEAGINIENEDLQGIFAAPAKDAQSAPDPDSIIQVAGRLRNVDQVNLYLYLFRRNGQDKGTPDEIAKANIDCAKTDVAKCEAVMNLNRLIGRVSISEQKQKHKFRQYIKYPREGGVIVDELRTLKYINDDILSSLSTEAFLERIEQSAPQFTIALFEKGTVNPEAVEGYITAKEERKEEIADFDSRFAEILLNDHAAAIEAAFYATDDRTIQERIRSHAGHIGSAPETPQSQAIRKAHAETLEKSSFAPLDIWLELYHLGFPHEAMRTAFDRLTELSKEKELRPLEERVKKLSQILIDRSFMERASEEKTMRIEMEKEEAEAELREIREKLDRRVIYIKPGIFRDFLSEFGTLNILKLTNSKNRRQIVGSSAPHIAIHADHLRAFKRKLGKDTGRAMTSDHITEAWIEATGIKPKTKLAKWRIENMKPEAMTRFKELFEYESFREGVMFWYVIERAKNFENFARNFGFSYESWTGENAPETVKKADFAQKVENILGVFDP